MKHRRVLVVVGTLSALLLMLLLIGGVGDVGDAPPNAVRNDAAALAAVAYPADQSVAATPVATHGTRVRMDAGQAPAMELICAVQRGMSAPFPGAAVRVDVQADGIPLQSHRLAADGEGIARITVAIAGAATATFAPGGPDVSGRAVTLFLHPEITPPTARLNLYPLDAEVRGVVTDLADRPLAMARVSWSRDCPAEACDAEGRFVLRVSSVMDSFRCLFLAPGHRSARENIALTAGSSVEVRVRLQPGPRVRGRVTAADGRPVAGAKVTTILQLLCGEHATTDQDGRYAIDCLLPERASDQVAVACPGFVPASAWVPTSCGDATCDFTMRAAGIVRGRVLRPDGGPAAGAVVSNRTDQDFGNAREETTANGNGAFVLDELAPGPCGLHAWCNGYPRAETNVTVLVGQEAAATICLAAGVTARGTVLDDVGQPVRGAFVVHASVGVVTDARGRFELVGLTADASTVDVLEKDHVILRGAPLAIAGDNRFVLARAGTLRGRVVDARTGVGLDDFTVAIVAGDTRQGSLGVDWCLGRGRRFQGTAGRWQANGLALVPGSVWRVRVTAPGCAAAVRTLVAMASPTTEGEAFALTAGVRVHGRLVAARSGAPFAGGTLRLLDQAPAQQSIGRHEPQTDSAGDGTFVFAPVAAGPVWIEIVVPGTPQKTAGPFTVGAEDLEVGELLVGTGPRLQGTLRDEQGQPLPDADLRAHSVHADATMPTLVRTRTGADGSFVFAGLQPGTWRLYAAIMTAAGPLRVEQRVQMDETDRTLEVQAGRRGIVAR